MVKKFLLDVIRILSLLICTALITLTVVIRARSPEMTETQLLISNWPLYVVIVGLGITAIVANEVHRRAK